MKIHEKILELKKNIQDIHNLSEKIDNNQSYKNKIEELSNEILRLKTGISESIEELEEFLGEEDVRN
ncbi:MAG: hypothetical protein HOI06_06930 [Pelagibacteraceae bacterium]|jgi:uncharacterized coiled-coil DUF342 family protein|nr:hypothetical protein [Pelagibacteraceae bacterium]MBT3901421.1 hypothetical protein [Pelagibacteraceae bacterium]MBT4645042.1 hypothetical protein [Pelagibacteraceae bacterium]MBT5213074.1 hypothetical protein [Pelagibacteraceae bacterium]MBT6198508.1 hypothetical protein [Pelagibacteraceae bacterium]